MRTWLRWDGCGAKIECTHKIIEHQSLWDLFPWSQNVQSDCRLVLSQLCDRVHPNMTDSSDEQSRQVYRPVASSDSDSDSGSEDEKRPKARRPRPPTGFGTSRRESALKLANDIGSSRWESATANVPFVKDTYDWKKDVKGGTIDKAKREHILKHNDVLNTSVPYSRTPEVPFASQEDVKAAYGKSRSATFGSSGRQDILVQYNVMGVAMPRSDCADAKFVDNPMPTIDSRFKAPRSFNIGKGSSRADHAKLVNSLGVAMPQDLTGQNRTELLEHPKNDSRFRRVRGAEDWAKQKTSREDIHKQANVLGSSTYHSYNPDADWPEDVYKTYRSGLGGVFAQAGRDEVLKHHNSLKVLVPHNETANVDYVQNPISKMDSRFRSNPSFSMGASKREDVFKQFNSLQASVPVGRTDTVKYVDNAISTFDSRFRSSTSPRFGADKTERDDILKLHNVLGVAMPSSLTSNASFAKVSDMKHLSTSKRVPSAHMGSSKREDIYKQANSLGSLLPIDRTPHADFAATKSKIDSRFPSSTSATFGVTTREDALKLHNSLNVALPSKEAGKTPYLHPDEFSDSITRNHARKGKGKWVNHEMGISSRTQHWKLANVMKVTTPFSAHTANVDFPKQVGYGLASYDPETGEQKRILNSKIRRAPGVSFGTTSREDALLQRDALIGSHPPHSRRVDRARRARESIETSGHGKKPRVPKTCTRASKLHFKVSNMLLVSAVESQIVRHCNCA